MLMTDPRPPVAERADLSNWRVEPFNRWAFHNVGEVVPGAEIGNAPGEPWRLDSAPSALDGFRLRLGDDAPTDLAGFLETTASDGLVVLHDGKIVHEAYGNGTTQHTPHILMSATKAVVGLVAGLLHRSGVLDPEALVSDHVPEIAHTAYLGATVRHLLDMRTGVVLDPAQQAAYEAATGWDPAPSGQPPGDLHTFFETLTAPHEEHGGPFRYVSANTDLLGWVIERAAGRPFATVASELLWRPMGAEAAASITVDPAGAPRCTGGLCATVRDFARIGRLMVEGGRRDSVEVLPEALIDDLANGGDPDAWADGEWGALFSFAGSRMRYRSGWYVIDDAPQTLFAMGIHGQNLFVDRANRIVIAKVSSQASPLDYRAVPLTHRAAVEIRRCLSAGGA